MLLLIIPVLNILMVLVLAYALYIYLTCITVHEANQRAVTDPFKNMVYDHDLCYRLHKDYYAFTI